MAPRPPEQMQLHHESSFLPEISMSQQTCASPSVVVNKALPSFSSSVTVTHPPSPSPSPSPLSPSVEDIQHDVQSTSEKQYDTQETPAPSRVRAKFAVAAINSRIPGAGRGIIAKEDIEAGELIFSVPEPIINICGNDGKSIRDCCDNCLACNFGQLSSSPVESLTLTPCRHCSMVYYCSETCRVAAYKHHHSVECGALSFFYRNYGLNPGSIIFGTDFRCILRLLIMRHYKKISSGLWNEILALKPLADAVLVKNFADRFPVIIVLLKTHVPTSMSEPEMLNLLSVITNNSLAITLPVLKNRGMPSLKFCPAISTGWCLEPFVSLINHDCMPNAWWVHEGKELHIRALPNIGKDEEITASYIGDNGHRELRQDLVMKGWGFECGCDLCVRQMTQIFSSNISPLAMSSESAVQQAIQDLLQSGDGYSSHDMQALYQQLLCLYFLEDNIDGALKACLMLFYAVQPAQHKPPVHLLDRLDTLFNLVTVLNLPSSGIDTSGFVMPPANIVKCSKLVVRCLRFEYCVGVEKCFGKDSQVSRFEHSAFEEEINKLAKQGWPAFKHVREDEQAKRLYKLGMDKILLWAGVNGVDEDALFM